MKHASTNSSPPAGSLGREAAAWLVPFLSAALLLSAIGCSGPVEVPGPDHGPHPVPMGADGKLDNYVSVTAREFILSGDAHVTLPSGYHDLEDEEARADALDRAVQTRLSVVSSSIRRHIDAALREANDGTLTEKDRYFTYFRRDHSQHEEVEVVDDERARFSFEMELVGNLHLMSVVAPATGSTHRTFEVEVSSWNDPEPELVTVTIRGSDSRDAFPRYDALFEDGVLSIAIHFGGDYNSERFDIDTAEWTVEHLLSSGFEHAEVEEFEDLHIASGPFTREIMVEKRPLEVQVFIYHAEMAAPPDHHQLADAMRASFATADVVIYSGHSGSGSGFVLDYNPRFDIPASAFEDLPLAEKYQIYVFDGCRTYRTYVDDLMKNERKTFENVDIVTTVNATPFGVGYQVLHQFIFWLTLTDRDGNHFPLSWLTILRGISQLEMAEGVHYGVHGVDDGPGLNPHASEGIACQPCWVDGDCGAGGNLCLGYGGGPACGVACASDTACPEGYRCARLYDLDEYWFIPKQCVRRDLICP